jgi:hypothetical protein
VRDGLQVRKPQKLQTNLGKESRVCCLERFLQEGVREKGVRMVHFLGVETVWVGEG